MFESSEQSDIAKLSIQRKITLVYNDCYRFSVAALSMNTC